MSTNCVPMYEMSINLRATWQAHSMSNVRSISTRTMGRRQLLADGTDVDACSGNILKYHHARLLAEFYAATGIPLCPACARGDGRRAFALVDLPGYEEMDIDRILSGCGLCDAHGFLVPGKNAASDEKSEEPQKKPDKNRRSKVKKEPDTDPDNSKARSRITKHSLLEFSFALALPDWQNESLQLFNRLGDDQALLHKPGRSGVYGMCVCYKSVGVGIDTDKWRIIVTDEAERIKRHQLILTSLRDSILSPRGALTAAMLPHLTGLSGVIVVQDEVGRAPIYSPLEEDYMSLLKEMGGETRRILGFESAGQFIKLMDELIKTTVPYLPAPRTPGPISL